MSIAMLREKIFNFLNNNEPAVVAIKGKWGVGKTYSWNSFLQTAKQKNNIKFERYSYVSLFGVNSLDALKYSIFENAIPTSSIGIEPNIETFQENTLALSEGFGRKAMTLVKNMPYVKDFAPALDALSFLSLKEIIVCIDDLERKGDGLPLKDVLGLVSHLKEQKKCKVVLLLNDGTSETKDYETYKEKVIDIEFTFKPTPDECAHIAYDGKKEFHNDLRSLTSNVGITNIRVLKKIERLIDEAYTYTINLDNSILYAIMHSIVLFSWSYYCYNDDELVPSIHFIENDEFMFYGSFNNGKDNDPKKLAWKEIINKYKYYNTSDLDRLLIGAVKDGYYNELSLDDEIKKMNESILDGKSRDDFTIAWGVYRDSFDNNQSDIIDSLYQSFLGNFKSIAPNNLDNLVCFLREFGENSKASHIIDVYIDGRGDELDLFNVGSRSLFGALEDGELVDKFNGFFYAKKSQQRGSLSEVLLRISNDRSWGNEDIDYLCSVFIEDYYHVFKTVRGDDLYKVVNGALLFGGIHGKNEEYRVIDNKVKWALTIISYESEINKRRVGNFVKELD